MSCMIIWDNFLVWVRFNKTNSHTSSTAHMSFLNLQNPPVDLSYCTPMPDQRRRQRTSTMRIQHSSMLLWSLLAVAGAFHLPVSPSVRAAHLSNPGSATTQGRTSTSKSTFGYASSTSITTATTALPMLGVTYPSFDEMIAGGERYEMVPLPDSMCTTTLWVGNLCEFTTDEQLSELFSEASVLSSLPACVARNPNASSRKYGFVTFPSVEEKEVRKCTHKHV